VLVGCYVLVGRVEETERGIEGFGALWFARVWGVPDYVVGVTIVAAGTSAPEFIVSLVAALRGAYGLSAGNLIGSDIFNMLGVVGLAGTVLQRPLTTPVMLSPAVVPSLIALCAVVATTILFMRTGWRISRWEGALLILMGAARWTMDFAFLGEL
jgi:cation:H+ antiporter